MPNLPFVTHVVRFLLAATLALGCRQCPLLAAGPTGEMIELMLKGQRIEGVPICWNEQNVHLLGRDGRLWQFEPNEASDFKKTSAHVRGYSPSEFRAELLRELGGDYEVSGNQAEFARRAAAHGVLNVPSLDCTYDANYPELERRE